MARSASVHTYPCRGFRPNLSTLNTQPLTTLLNVDGAGNHLAMQYECLNPVASLTLRCCTLSCATHCGWRAGNYFAARHADAHVCQRKDQVPISTSLTKGRIPLEPNRRPMPRVLGGS